MKKVLLLFLGIALANWASSQSFKYEFIDENRGLFERFVYSLEQDDNGYILIGTTEGMFRYDGFQFKQFGANDGLVESFVTSSCKFQDFVLLGHNEGGISFYDGEHVDSVYVSTDDQSRVKTILTDDNNFAYAFYQDGKVVRIDSTLQSIPLDIDFEGALVSCAYYQNDHIYIGTDFGLGDYSISTGEMVWNDAFLGFQVSCITSCAGPENIVVACEEEGLFSCVTETQEVIPFELPFTGFQTMKVNRMQNVNGEELWLATKADGMIRLSNLDGYSYQRAEFINKGKTKTVESIATFLIDRENIIWLGSQGEGLVKMNDNIFTQYELGLSKHGKMVRGIAKDDSVTWVGTNIGLLKMTNELDSTMTTYGTEHGAPSNMNITSLFKDEEGLLWIGTYASGLYYLDDKDRFHSVRLAEDLLNQRVNYIAGQGGIIYVGTNFGLYQMKNKKVVSHLSMRSGLPHNVVNAMHLDSQGRMWVGANSSTLTYIEDGIIQNIELPLQGKIVDIVCFTEDKDGRIWVGTDGAGVLMINGQKWRLYDRDMGLFSDYSYSIHADPKGDVWVGHRGGLSMINPASGYIEVYDSKVVGLVNFERNATASNQFGELFLGTDNGILKCATGEEVPESMMPVINLTSVMISDSLHNHGEYINLGAGAYKFEFEFRGINFRDAKDVTYRYFLEGHDLEWSESTSSNIARYSRLNPGEYTFKVRAYNKNDVGSEDIASVTFFIDYPFWQKWWFYFTVTGFIFFVVRLVIKRRERIMIQNAEFLKRELDIRTSEVVNQKEELEVKNKDITDSILYAKNIQRAMLPDSATLEAAFAESFVFLKPRDIVSGDFYWVERFENKIIIACADCTGHGVPGAFMSMIGIVLLKDVSRNKDVWSPATMLSRLNAELTEMLHSESTDFSVQDGMDISIVEFDFETNKLRASSARRPVIIYKDGQQMEIKGDRFSIGGDHEGAIKDFTLHEVQLKQGDTFYQFSDGITDQFGGPNGKKLKKSGVLQMLDGMQKMSLEAQRKAVHHKFFQWKGHHDQIDDVILVGVKV